MTKSSLLPIALLALLSACAPAGPGDSVAAGDIPSGGQLFASNCAGCHGADAQGASAPSIAGVSDSQQVIDTILNGNGGMPAFASSLSDADISDILAYLGSL